MSGNIQTWQHRTLISESILSFFFSLLWQSYERADVYYFETKDKTYKKVMIIIKKEKDSSHSLRLWTDGESSVFSDVHMKDFGWNTRLKPNLNCPCKKL